MENYIPGPDRGFEEAVQYRKHQVYNSVNMIAYSPDWKADGYPSTYADSHGIYLRNAWEKFGYYVDENQITAKGMRDEYGNQPFAMSREHPGVADFDFPQS